MSTTHDLIAELARYDAELVRTADGLKVSAPAPVPAELMARLRQHKAELLQLLAGEAEKAALHTNYSKGYRHLDGTVSDGKPEPMPPPAADWPDDLDDLLRRVATAFEWTQQDVADFRQWARRSPDGLADARTFLQTECDKLDIRLAKGQCRS